MSEEKKSIFDGWYETIDRMPGPHADRIPFKCPECGAEEGVRNEAMHSERYSKFGVLVETEDIDRKEYRCAACDTDVDDAWKEWGGGHVSEEE